MRVVEAVLIGQVNSELVGRINAIGGEAVGLSGISANIYKCVQRSEELGFVGDIVEVNGFRGVVTKIGIRTTSITDGGGNVKIINNSEMKNILNRSDNNSWSVSDISIPYETDLEKLEAQLPALLEAGLDSVNISLDTLDPALFAKITARDEFAAVQAGIHAALESGIPVKLNCVPQVGVNEGELEALAALAQDKPLQVRFIEMMPIGYGAAMPCISGPELLARFRRRWPELAPLPGAACAALGDGPAVYYTVPGWKGDIGFIAAVHGKFCASCNRVRLTSQGFLRPCLASETGTDLRALLRKGFLYRVTVLRGVVFPLLFLLVLRLLPLDNVLRTGLMVIASCPAGSLAAVVAKQSGTEPALASQAVAHSTICMLVTVPVMLLLTGQLFPL